jgi:hypothetical protein
VGDAAAGGEKLFETGYRELIVEVGATGRIKFLTGVGPREQRPARGSQIGKSEQNLAKPKEGAVGF